MRKFLGTACIITNIDEQVSRRGYKIPGFLSGCEGGIHSMDPSPLPEDARIMIFSSRLLTGTFYIIVNSLKDKGKALKEHNLMEIVPCVFDARIDEEITRTASTGHHRP